ncbi:MAG: hypothetical protein J7604_12970 [Sporocytophaga sp.]|uniref:hypothetical protein n=1 Tax=Sporocytophaga sp. TaxID=2231183 RepID=UPI001AFEA2F7|nr:hypothetical protein [Sporocytophaga sp.]MBO9701116.1 hypothetical protein [Sporocytophaga sp.]
MAYRLTHNLKNILAVLLLSISLIVNANGQNDSTAAVNKGLGGHIKFGFNYHLQLQHIDVAPVIFYRLNDRVDVGVGLNYLYYYRNDKSENNSAFGTNIFTRVYFLKNFFLHLEYLYCNVPYRNDLNFEYRRVYITNLFSGLGYRQPITSKVDSYFLGLIDLTHRDESPYKNLIIVKLGISF